MNDAPQDNARWQDCDPGLIEAVKERHQQQMVEAIERHQQTRGELEESLAQIIYEQAIIPAARHCHTDAPKWVVGGNSICQDDARVAARAIIRRWPREEQVIAENIQRQLLHRIDTLETELERERLRLTACGIAAKADTPESAAKARDIHPDCRSTSLDEVCEMVDRLMAARARLNEQESITSADAASSGKERLAQQVIAENIQRQLLRRIDTLEQELERKYPRLTADAASSGKERLAQQVKRKMLENLDRSCDTTTAEIIEQIADWIAQTLRSEAGR